MSITTRRTTHTAIWYHIKKNNKTEVKKAVISQIKLRHSHITLHEQNRRAK